MQMARYSVKLSYLSPYSQSSISNFTLFTLLFTFLFHFLSSHSSLLSFSSVPLYSLSCTPFCVPPSLSATLIPPCSCLSLRSKLHVAMNSLPGNELCTLRSSGNAWPEESRSLFLALITPPVPGYDTLEQGSYCCTQKKS